MIIAANGALYNTFGRELEVSGSRVVVGAHKDDDAGENSCSSATNDFVFCRGNS